MKRETCFPNKEKPSSPRGPSPRRYIIDSSSLFRLSFILIFSLLTGIRTYFRITTGAIHDRIFTNKEGVFPVLIRWLFGVPLFLATGSYIFLRARNLWLYLPIPFVLRLSGVFIGFFSVYFIYLVHRELGSCFSSGLVIRNNHKLIKTGPYKFVRHPMYSSYLLLFLSSFLISGNWAIGLFGITVIVTLMTIRMVKEEALLVEKFGDEYREYRKNTGMFIPMTHKLGIKIIKDYSSR